MLKDMSEKYIHRCQKIRLVYLTSDCQSFSLCFISLLLSSRLGKMNREERLKIDGKYCAKKLLHDFIYFQHRIVFCWGLKDL